MNGRHSCWYIYNKNTPNAVVQFKNLIRVIDCIFLIIMFSYVFLFVFFLFFFFVCFVFILFNCVIYYSPFEYILIFGKANYLYVDINIFPFNLFGFSIQITSEKFASILTLLKRSNFLE